MFVTFRGSVLGMLRWQWKSVLHFLVASSTVVVLDHFYESHLLKLPTLPLVVVGAAVGIFTSFRTNACYDRWWEGRKLWGRLVNTSRHLCTQVLTFLPSAEIQATELGPTSQQRRIVHRHIAYVHSLRILMRKQDLKSDREFLLMVPEQEREAVIASSNPTHALLHAQEREFAALANEGKISEIRLQSLDASIAQLLDIQGGCERIKNTPFPRSYGWIAERLVWAYSVLFPMAVVEEMGWVTIPLTLLVCLSFSMINETGRILEDPFTLFWPALPLSALSRTIEVNLRERLSETGLPPLLGPDKRGILM
jgi:ion channel-forming bestrophin family protein